jgi:hypothetical protein
MKNGLVCQLILTICRWSEEMINYSLPLLVKEGIKIYVSDYFHFSRV